MLRELLAGLAGALVELALFVGRRDVDLVVRVHRSLEVLDRLTEPIAELRQLGSAEDDNDNDEDEDELPVTAAPAVFTSHHGAPNEVLPWPVV